MAKSPTSKSKWPSRYSPQGWVTGTQYLAELMCEAKARKEKTELPLKFWELKEWAKYYQFQVVTASRLVKEISVEALIKAAKDKRCFYIYSLKSVKLVEILSRPVKNCDFIEPVNDKIIQPTAVNKTIVGKLD